MNKKGDCMTTIPNLIKNINIDNDERFLILYYINNLGQNSILYDLVYNSLQNDIDGCIKCTYSDSTTSIYTVVPPLMDQLLSVIKNVPEVQARYRNEYIISYEIIENSMNVIIKRRV
jgi:ABC-type maltose transport system permease subunit